MLGISLERPALAFAAVMAAAPAQGAYAQQRVVDLEPRPGVTLRYLALPAASTPKVAVLLLTGGQGVLNMPDRPGPNWSRQGNFLVRSREEFRRHGLFVAVIDAPSDRKGDAGLGSYRIDPQHAEDIATVIADVRRQVGAAQIWVIGTSRGTISAANVAARLAPPKGPDGLVLTSTATRRGGGSRPRAGNVEMVYDLDLSAVRVPTLLVAHSDDTCFVSPPADVPALQRSLSNAPRVAAIAIEGGDPPQSDPCEALAAHGFLGREAETVKAIVDWILDPKS